MQGESTTLTLSKYTWWRISLVLLGWRKICGVHNADRGVFSKVRRRWDHTRIRRSITIWHNRIKWSCEVIAIHDDGENLSKVCSEEVKENWGLECWGDKMKWASSLEEFTKMSFTFYDLQNKSFVVAQDVTKCQDFVESVVLTAL